MPRVPVKPAVIVLQILEFIQDIHAVSVPTEAVVLAYERLTAAAVEASRPSRMSSRTI